MATRRCSLDGINYPMTYQFTKCLVCGEDTLFLSNDEEDEDWKERAARALEHIKNGTTPMPDIKVIDGKVRFDGEQYWIHGWDIFPHFQSRLKETDLIQIGLQVFEILAYVHNQREYLVRPFSMTLSDDDLHRLAGG
jgi:hypothetical protein